MKILHTESVKGWGGQGIRVLNESLGMIAKGHNVIIACPGNSMLAKKASEAGIPVQPLPINKKTLTGMLSMRKYLSAQRFDVINTHSSTDSWLVAVSLLFSRNRPKVVRTRHISTAIRNDVATLWLYSRGCDFIVTAGERLREQLNRENNIPLEKMKSIPTGSDEALFVPTTDSMKSKELVNLPTDQIIIGIVAKMRAWKGHDCLVEALRKLGRNDVHLLIVGDGPKRDELEPIVPELPYKVTFTGEVNNVGDYLRAMDIFCLPSYGFEGLPQAMMQAMLCRLPVITTDVGSTTDLIKHEQNGLIVNIKDSDDLKQAIETLIENPNLRTTYAERAYKVAIERCSLTRMLDDMEGLFQRVIAK
ncbi:glycosyltransferase family 4 protein [Vibrio sp. YIC-376]|uniref:glycosyltransferase family 4 protein n=1 Tax=Vibrio sp. YIC-376 TaxID=3136162 RepID=UPI00402A98D8